MSHHGSPLWPAEASRYSAPTHHAFGRLWANLASRYSEERAAAIFTGADPQTREDLIKWRRLGRPKQEQAQ